VGSTLRDDFDVRRDEARALGIQLSLQGGPILDELADRVAREKEAYDGGTVAPCTRKAPNSKPAFTMCLSVRIPEKRRSFLTASSENMPRTKTYSTTGCYDGLGGPALPPDATA
jgi:hypothetical protein